ncbi:MAG TPA: cytochrome c [Burkholderiales bacterium]|nr:cytochrome c [Burkholderiales bacterium]
MLRRFIAAVAIALAPAALLAADRIELPAGPNRDLVYAKCRTCHDLQYVKESAGITADNWQALVEDMGQYGLRIPDAERDKIVKYLVTYLGPNPPAPAPAGSPSPAIDGAAMYARQCSACHQAHGGGIANTFPPLAGNTDLYRDRMFPVYVVLNGLTGAITVKGAQYNGTMPPFDHLSDAEIAAVIGYVRAAWENAELRPAGFVDVDESAVKKARAKPMNNTEVHAYRAAH